MQNSSNPSFSFLTLKKRKVNDSSTYYHILTIVWRNMLHYESQMNIDWYAATIVVHFGVPQYYSGISSVTIAIAAYLVGNFKKAAT